ncbi:MAG TPA: hypothetical protein D7H86_04420, partial [Candidatus Poseidoniales archaeon]
MANPFKIIPIYNKDFFLHKHMYSGFSPQSATKKPFLAITLTVILLTTHLVYFIDHVGDEKEVFFREEPTNSYSQGALITKGEPITPFTVTFSHTWVDNSTQDAHVGSTTQTGRNSDIAIDSNGNIHMCHHRNDLTDGKIKYTTNAGGSW